VESIEFGRLYERYASDVMRFALFLTGSRAEAQDITSETFVRAWIDSDRIRVGTVKAYLFMIARNLHVDWRRGEARKDALAVDLADPSAGPESESGSRSELRLVMRLLQQLPEVDRAALLMRTLEELPYESIATVLDLSTVAARVKDHRARARLQELRELARQGKGV
jgi:RNA polymerase sigma-70 factor (ECF subfamily)